MNDTLKALITDPRKDDLATLQTWQNDLFNAIYEAELSQALIGKLFKSIEGISKADLEADWKAFLGVASDAVDGQTADNDSKAVKVINEVKTIIEELFLDENGDAYADVRENNKLRTYDLKGSSFKGVIRRFMLQERNQILGKDMLASVVATLEAEAEAHENSKKVFIRVAEQKGLIYLDLANAENEVIEISKQGWQVIPRPSDIKFLRMPNMLALPYPKQSRLSLYDLAEFINVKPEDLCLILAWLVQACRANNGAYPILIFESQQGSGKSETMRKTRRLLDPSSIDIRKQPKDDEAVMVAAKNGWLVAYDNLSYLGSSLSDTLCVVSTGAANGKRKNYSDSEEAVYKVKRPLMISSIKEITTQPDLMQRSIIIELPKISPSQRKSETELEEAFDKAHPELLAALCDTLSHGLASKVKLSRLPRMADFAGWAVACLGQEVLARYDANLDSHHDVAIDASPIGRVLIDFIDSFKDLPLKLTPEDLRNGLVSFLESQGKKQSSIKDFPRNAAVLSNQINQIKPNLFELGYACESTKSRDENGKVKRYWVINKLTPEDTPDIAADRASTASTLSTKGKKGLNVDAVDGVDDKTAKPTTMPRRESFVLEADEVII